MVHVAPQGRVVGIDRQGQKVRHFVWEELAQLNSRQNAHISIRGKVTTERARRWPALHESLVTFVPPPQVYDVSGFVSRHPGGVDQIMLGAGRDATQLFESYHKLDTHK